MCLAVLALHTLDGLPVLVAANRDEFHERPTQPASAWPGRPAIYGGRDLRAGGSWMAVNELGRYAIVTNFRDPAHLLPDARTRGELVHDYLRGDATPAEFAADVHARGAQYNGFNLILGDTTAAWYATNRDGAPRRLPPGIYAVSNHLLDTPWPKLARTKAAFERVLRHSAQPDLAELYATLRDDTPADDASLPVTGIGRERERLLSSPFIVSPDYGTRGSTVLALHADGRGELHERRYGTQGEALGDTDIQFRWRATGGR